MNASTFSSRQFASGMDAPDDCEELYKVLKKQGDYIVKEASKMSKEILDNDVELNLAKTSIMLEESLRMNVSGAITSDGDQSPLKGFESQALRMMWAEGGDYCPPTNPNSSQWAKDCYNGNLEKISKHLYRNPGLLELRESSLHMAALHYVIAGARTIDPIKSNINKFPKHICVKVTDETDHIGSIKYLLEMGARVEAKDVAGHTPLHHCVTLVANNLSLEIARILIKIGKADVNSVNRFGATPLFEPLMNGRKDCVELLVKHGANLNVTDNDGLPLIQLSKCGRFISKKDEMMADAMVLYAESRQKVAKEQGIYRVCTTCKGIENIKRCSRCYMTWYCSITCQKLDWESHKNLCNEIHNEYEQVPKICITNSDPKHIPNYIARGTRSLVSVSTKKCRYQHIVKIQVSTEELSQKKDTGNLEEDTKEFKSPLLIYNRDRTICFFMSKDCPIYKSIIK